jgi:peptidoglycan/LPS O-acetylase OafA/YrhL
MLYRGEIDGLRAFAVLPVIFYHSGLEGLTGGFVGVDVFFVISGYLITTLISEELSSRGEFSFVSFYERRARRLLPALFAMILVCVPLAWIILLPLDLIDFSESVVATTLFSSNILFYSKSGYFDAASDFRPLLHTWTLAVEEQFYLFFPLFFVYFIKSKKRFLNISIALMFAASLFSAVLLSSIKPTAAFFLLPTRLWEFLIGTCTALFLFRSESHALPSRSFCELGGWLGFFLILFSYVTFSHDTRHPSFFTLVPTVGTALVIIFTGRTTTLTIFLRHKTFVSIGLVSYGAYLWHQPVFAFARHWVLVGLNPSLSVMLIGVTFALAYLSWRFIETPCRSPVSIPRQPLLFLVLVTAFLFVGAGSFSISNDGFKTRLPPNTVWQTLGEKTRANGDVCEMSPLTAHPGIVSCEFGDRSSERRVVLYGDSHAQAIAGTLGEELSKLGIRGVHVGISGCHVVPAMVDTKDDIGSASNCAEKFRILKNYLSELNSPIILISRWTFRLYPIDGVIDEMPSRNSDGGRERESYREYAVYSNSKLDYTAEGKKAAVGHLLRGVIETGNPIVLIYPVPEISWDIAALNLRYWTYNKALLMEISIPYTDYLSRNKFIIDIFDRHVESPNVIPIKPADIFCNTFRENRCVAQFKGVPYYYDDDHLSDDGAKLLVDRILMALDQRGVH